MVRVVQHAAYVDKERSQAFRHTEDHTALWKSAEEQAWEVFLDASVLVASDAAYREME